MRHRYLLVGSLLISVTSFGQTGAAWSKIAPTESSAGSTHTVATKPATSSEAPSYFEQYLNEDEGITIVAEDFSAGIPATWTNTSLAGGNERWEYRGPATTPSITTGSRGAYATGTGVIQSATRTNGFVIFDSDWWDNGGTATGVGQAPLGTHKGALTMPSIDCSSYPGVIILFTQYLRNYASDHYVIVSTDGFTTEDTVYNASDFVELNESSADDELVRIDISSIAAGQPDVRIRFLYSSDDNTTASSGPGYYFWQLDDIVVATPPDNDLALQEVYWDGASSSATSQQAVNYYTSIPLKQAQSDVITFGAAISNDGTVTQNNTELTVNVTGPTPFTGSSTPQNLAAGAVDTIDVTTTYSPAATGNYTVNIALSSDSTDDFISNNTSSAAFSVTEHLYSRDNDDVTTGWSYNNAQNYSILTRYEFNAADTVKAVHIQFFSSTGFETSIGSVVEVGIWPVLAGGVPSTIATDGEVDFNNPIGGTVFHTITAGDLNNTVEIMYPAPIAVPVGEVVVGFRVQSGQVRTASTDQENAPLQSFVDVDNDGIDGWIDFTPIIRVETYSAAICNTTTITVLANITCDNANYEALIESVVSHSAAGAHTYTYEWSNSETTEDITVTAEGDYSVTVTDENFCQGTGLFTVANGDINCNLAVGELGGESFSVAVLPNPNNGVFNLSFASMKSENVQLQLQTLKGEVVYQDAMTITDGFMTTVDLNSLSTGIYLLKVTGETHTSTERIVVQ